MTTLQKLVLTLKIQLDWSWCMFVNCVWQVWAGCVVNFRFFQNFSFGDFFTLCHHALWQQLAFIHKNVSQVETGQGFWCTWNQVDCSWNHKVLLKIHEKRAWPRQKKCPYGRVLALGLLGLHINGHVWYQHYWLQKLSCDLDEPTRVLPATPGFDNGPDTTWICRMSIYGIIDTGSQTGAKIERRRLATCE